MAWIVPDLALVAATVTLFYCLFLFQGYQKLFRDSDAGWHIRTGESILATRTLPRTDPYSFSRPGQPWFAWEWASDVAVGAIHRAGGLRAVALFYGGAIAASVWMWVRLHWAMRGDFLVACGMAPLLLTTCELHWLARPHVLGWLFLMGAVWYAESRAADRFSARDALVVAGYTALWANVHASFFLGVAIAAIYAAGRRSPWFLWAALIAAIAPLANPYGWQLYRHVFRYLTDSELLSRIAEFQSFNFHAEGSGQIIAALLIGMGGGALALVCGRYEHFLLAAMFSAMALRSARALPLAALVLLPVANGAITATLGLSWRKYAANLRAIDSRGCGLAWAAVMLLVAFAGLRAMPTGFSPAEFPVAAYSHIPAEARLFAPDKFGGYLIYRSAGARKVFFDGRSDFYGAEFLKQYGRLVQLRPGWREWWDSFQFSHALLPPDFPLTGTLEQAGWHPIYQDASSILLERGGS